MSERTQHQRDLQEAADQVRDLALGATLTDEHLAHAEKLIAAALSPSGARPVAWPKPGPKRQSWTIDPVFLDQVRDEAWTIENDPVSCEQVEAVLLAALKLHPLYASPSPLAAEGEAEGDLFVGHERGRQEVCSAAVRMLGESFGVSEAPDDDDESEYDHLRTVIDRVRGIMPTVSLWRGPRCDHPDCRGLEAATCSQVISNYPQAPDDVDHWCDRHCAHEGECFPIPRATRNV